MAAAQLAMCRPAEGALAAAVLAAPAARPLWSAPGRVFIQPVMDAPRVTVGKVKVLSGSSLKEQGSGVVAVRMDAQLSDTHADEVLLHILQDQSVRILLELQFEVGVSVSFGLGQWGTSAPFRKKCGLKMAGLLVNRFVDAAGPDQKSRLGPLVCRTSFEGMEIPDVGDAERLPEDGRMGFTAAQVAPAEVAAGERTKNLSLLTAMLLSYSCGLALLYAAWLSVGRPQLDMLSSRTCVTPPRSAVKKWKLARGALSGGTGDLPTEEGAMLHDEDDSSGGEAAKD